MRTKTAKLDVICLLALVLVIGLQLVSPRAAADQTNATAPTGSLTTTGRLNFQILYPLFLRFRVGTASATIDQISFAPIAAQVGSGIAISGTGGDAAGTGANVSVYSNAGQVTITPTNNSGGSGLGTGILSDGFVSYSEISTSTTIPQLPAPVLANFGGTSVLPIKNNSIVTQRAGIWNFSYLNTTVPSAGTFGSAANGGRVTYTASTP